MQLRLDHRQELHAFSITDSQIVLHVIRFDAPRHGLIRTNLLQEFLQLEVRPLPRVIKAC